MGERMAVQMQVMIQVGAITKDAAGHSVATEKFQKVAEVFRDVYQPGTPVEVLTAKVKIKLQ